MQWWPSKNSEWIVPRGGIWLEFFDWGIRLCGAINFVTLGWSRLMTPVLEFRYEELTEARLVTTRTTRKGVRLRAGALPGAVFFWTEQGSEVLDRLQQHAVPVRAPIRVTPPAQDFLSYRFLGSELVLHRGCLVSRSCSQAPGFPASGCRV
jgi:hypothetical protein